VRHLILRYRLPDGRRVNSLWPGWLLSFIIRLALCVLTVALHTCVCTHCSSAYMCVYLCVPLSPPPSHRSPTLLLTVGLEELLGVQVALQHALVEQHVAHGLRDDDVHLLGERHLLHLPRDDDHAIPQAVAVHQHLRGGAQRYAGTINPRESHQPGPSKHRELVCVCVCVYLGVLCHGAGLHSVDLPGSSLGREEGEDP